DQQTPVLEIDVLHPQAQRFQQTQPGSIEQTCDQPFTAINMPEQTRDLLLAQHRRQTLWTLRPHDIRQIPKRLLENLRIEKVERAQRLVLRTRRDVAVGRQMG